MSLSSHLAMGDVGALLSGPLFLMADPLGPLLDEDEKYLGGISSPHSFSSADSPTSLLSSSPPPSPSHPSALGCKLGDELLPLPWLCDSGVLDISTSPAGGKDDSFSSMDWMAEDLDLSQFDLDSLMGSYDSDEPPSSPEELIASLESHLDLDPEQFTATSASGAPLPQELAVLQADLPPLSPVPSPEPQSVIEIKSEPASPALLPAPLPAVLPSDLEVGSEVDVAENERTAPGIILSLSASHIVLILAPKEEPAALPLNDQSDSDSDSGISSISGSPRPTSCTTPPPSAPAPTPTPTPRAASRPKPYSISKSEPAAKPGKVKSPSAAPVVVEKKLKKMEQNKTAATRYRQKKRVEQESLSSECSRLEQRNRELSEKADSISKEIQYLKGLIEEVRNAKNRRKGRPEEP